MKIWDLSIKKPVTTIMIVLIVLILGGVSFSKLNVDLLPEMNLPYAVVVTQYSGASPSEVESIVTKNLESTLSSVSNMQNVQSVSSEGSSIIIMEFASGTNLDNAMLDVREKLDLIKPMLPDTISNPMVLKLDPNMMPVMQLGVAGNKSKEELSKWVEDVLQSRLERIEGVASISVVGNVQKHISINISPDKLAAYSLSASNVTQTLAAENLNMPAGSIVDGIHSMNVRVVGEVKDIETLKKIKITNPRGAVYSLGSIAEIKMVDGGSDSYAVIDGEDAIIISVSKESNANTSKVAKLVNEELEKIKTEEQDIEFISLLDQGKYVDLAISNVSTSAIIGGLLAILILLLFLKNIRATIVIGISIPISVIATFVLIYFSGITLNIVSLGGLALGVGMLVDNSIVVLESIYKDKQAGLSTREAASKGTKRVALAIIASTLTTICVFLPVIFLEGITAEIFKQMAFTITFSLISSLVVAISLVPMLSSQLINDKSIKESGKVEKKVEGIYSKALGWSLAHRKTIVLVTLATFVVSLVLIPVVGSEFFPAADQGTISISVGVPKGASFDYSSAIMKKVEAELEGIEEIENYGSNMGGTNVLGSLTGASGGSINITLKERAERKRSTDEIASEIEEKVSDIAGAEINVSAASSMFSMGSSSSGVSLQIKGDDLEKLEQIGDELIARFEKLDGVKDATSSLEKGVPEIQIIPNKSMMGALGVNTAMVASAVSGYLQDSTVTKIKTDAGEISVNVTNPDASKIKYQDLENIHVTTMKGTKIPLNSVAEIKRVEGPSSIYRSGQVRYITMSVEFENTTLGQVTSLVTAELDAYDFPQGYSYEIGGEAKQLLDTFSGLFWALILGIVLVYMVMAAQFESFKFPFIIMFAIPLTFIGVVLALLLTGTSLSVPAYIGIIVLMGIVVNNGIVLIDYINQLRRSGLEKYDAIVKAGPARLRPILMTSLTTILGLVPMAIGLGEGSETTVPLAIAVIGGLSASTILTLIVVPVMYSIFDRKKV